MVACLDATEAVRQVHGGFHSRVSMRRRRVRHPVRNPLTELHPAVVVRRGRCRIRGYSA